jgi:2-polyprenyl-3-methyl-5-hydroxy-6-metoxy-1,4-benzoquinol methylase
MALLPDISQRSRLAESMDDPSLDEHRHAAALAGLARLNRAAGAAGILWPAIGAEIRAAGSRRLRLLDIASGSGDVPVLIARRARRAGLPIEVHGCDVSPRAVAIATQRAQRARLEGASFFRLDVLHDEIPAGYDILTCSLFLHHLADEQAVDLLYRIRCAARQLLLVSDLERRRDGLVLAWSASRILTRSNVVRNDALLSVRAAYTLEELEELAIAAGLESASLKRCWPCRLLLMWRRA